MPPFFEPTKCRYLFARHIFNKSGYIPERAQDKMLRLILRIRCRSGPASDAELNCQNVPECVGQNVYQLSHFVLHVLFHKQIKIRFEGFYICAVVGEIQEYKLTVKYYRYSLIIFVTH